MLLQVFYFIILKKTKHSGFGFVVWECSWCDFFTHLWKQSSTTADINIDKRYTVFHSFAASTGLYQQSCPLIFTSCCFKLWAHGDHTLLTPWNPLCPFHPSAGMRRYASSLRSWVVFCLKLQINVVHIKPVSSETSLSDNFPDVEGTSSWEAGVKVITTFARTDTFVLPLPWREFGSSHSLFSTHHLGRRIFSPGVLEQLKCEVVMANVEKLFPFWLGNRQWEVQKGGE